MKVLPVTLVLLALMSSATSADQVGLVFGGDSYAAGQNISITQPVARDAFMAGYDVTLAAAVSGSAHLAGYHVTANAAVGGDLYVAGFTVSMLAPVARDVTAIGNSVLVKTPGPIPGNARLAGASLVVDSSISGSVLATAQTLTLNAPIAGDLSFYGESLNFGPNARVDGKLSIQAPNAISVPPSVASPERVTFQQITTPDYAGEAGKTAGSIVKGFWFAVWAAALWWLLLFVVGAAFIATSPRLVSELSSLAEVRPFRRLGLGVLAFAATIGLVLVVILTLIGVILLPLVLLYIFVACSLAYLAGVYLVGQRIWSAITPVSTNPRRIVVLAVSLVIAGLLTMVPLLGWPITLLLLVFGFGVFASRVITRWGKSDSSRLAGGPADTTNLSTPAAG